MKNQAEIRLAAIDMGTNSFHARFVLLPPSGEPVLLDRTKIMVDLAPDGLGKPLTPEAQLRGLHALQTIRDEADILEMDHIMAYATSAIREANNGEDYLRMLEDRTGIRAQIITGEREGELIANGMRQTVQLDDEIVMGVDIGGGSVEFIFMNRDEIFEVKSKKLGVARLKKGYLKHDPVLPEELAQLSALYTIELQDVIEDIKGFNVRKVYGSSGTLRTAFKAVLYYNEQKEAEFYDMDGFNLFYHAFIGLGLSERMTFKGVDSARVELIVPGLQLMHFLLNKTPIEKVYYASGALREGMIIDMMQGIRSINL